MVEKVIRIIVKYCVLEFEVLMVLLTLAWTRDKNTVELNKCKDIAKKIKLYINSEKGNLEYKIWVDWKTNGTLRSVVKLDSNYYDFLYNKLSQ